MQGREAKMLKDNELVQIGGFNVYNTPEGGRVDFNDGRYKCVKKEGTNPQYAVFVNEATGEAVLAFNGTDKGEGDDIRTDFQLGGKGVPPMHEQALEIYHDLKNQYNIVALCGNSLGGSLANYVSINTGIRSVTINPAVLPNDPNVNCKNDYDNITNYIATEDPLDKLQTNLIKEIMKNNDNTLKPIDILAKEENVSIFIDDYDGMYNRYGDGLNAIMLDCLAYNINIFITKNNTSFSGIDTFTNKLRLGEQGVLLGASGTANIFSVSSNNIPTFTNGILFDNGTLIKIKIPRVAN